MGNAAATVVMRVTGLLSTLVLMPVLMAHLGNAQLGAWLLLASLTQMLAFTDLGLGNGLMTAIASASGSRDRGRLASFTASGTAALLAVTAALLIVTALAWFFLPWRAWGGDATAQWSREEWQAFWVAATCMLLTAPALIGARVQSGLQRAFIPSAWQSAGNLITLAAMLTAVEVGARLPLLVAIFFGIPALVMLLHTAWVFGAAEAALRPRRAAIDPALSLELARTSGVFFALQCTLAVTFATDNLVLAWMLGVDAVPAYAIPARLFGYITLGIGIFLSPLWPAYAEAIARGDRAWVRRTFVRSIAGAVAAATILATALYLLREPVFHRWMGPEFVVRGPVLAALAAWTVLESGATAAAMFLNGARLLGIQLGVAGAFAIASLPIRAFLISEFGVTGLPLGTIVAYTLTTALPLAVIIPLHFRRVAAPLPSKQVTGGAPPRMREPAR